MAADEYGEPAFIYEPGHILTRRADVRRVREALEDIDRTDDVRGRRRPRPGEEAPSEGGAAERADVVRLRVNGDVLRILRLLADILGIGVVTPNHLFSITPVAACPSGEPLVVDGDDCGDRCGDRCGDPAPLPRWNRDRTAGKGVGVLIVDTGLLDHYAREHPWLRGGPDPSRAIDDPQPGIQRYEGHGTFIAGVLRCVAPSVTFGVSNAMRPVGTLYEHQLGPALLGALQDWANAHGGRWPAIINLSSGTPTQYSLPPIGLEQFRKELEKNSDTILVAAAGNNGSTKLFWPAAYAADYPQVISVGALRRYSIGRHERACFSNYGDWVTVFAPGEWLVNAFAWGDYEYAEPHHDQCIYLRPPVPSYAGCTCVDAPALRTRVTFDGMARWSGTSFAAPVVAGLIAGLMSRSGMTARQAADELLVKARAPGWRSATGDPVLLPPGWPAAGSP
ncbi:S8 family peptidase [Sphaerisporangium aureirubrum]|uniref:S8 family serine peptidase n=1 Tax=Sphaerisporangium aureirubrum TaxID=1544736 RepID=A0ABW1NRP8_9ACTN